MRLKWLPSRRRGLERRRRPGTWIIVNTNMAGKPNWWLCVHPWDSNDFEERGKFPQQRGGPGARAGPRGRGANSGAGECEMSKTILAVLAALIDG